MSNYFTYNSSGIKRITGPIFPDFNPDSELSIKMAMAKSSDTMDYWTVMREVLAYDYKTLPLDRFKVWASVWNVPFICKTKFIDYVAISARAASIDQTYASALMEPMVGCDQIDFVEHLSVFDDFPTTHNRLVCMGHLLFCGYTPEKLSKMDRIIEFGAGIGELCDIIYKLGFKGQYIIYDFPEVGAIQKWYHTALGHQKVLHTSDLSDLSEADLCIGTWSLTEMPLTLRDQILERTKDSKNWLISYSKEIFGIDNEAWVNEVLIPTCGANKEVTVTPINSMPWHGGAKYLTIKEVD